MKIATVILGLLLSLGMLTAPAHADEQHVVAFGDSIANGGGTYNPDRYAWPTLMGAERTGVPGGCLVTTADLCGSHMRPAIGFYGRTVLSQRPDVVIVAYGMNDLVHSTPSQIRDGIRALKDHNDRRGIETYVATLTPLGDRFFGLNRYRVRLNTLIRRSFGSHVIDFDAALISPVGDLPNRFDSGDNLHPNARAYKVMAKVARTALKQQR